MWSLLVVNAMDFESPDVEKDFPGLYASESGKKSNESDFSDDTHERVSKKDLLIGKRKDKKDSKKDRGYATLEGESSAEEDSADVRSPSKSKKSKPFKFPSKKEKREKSREKDNKEKDCEKDKDKKKDCDKEKDKDKDKKKEGKIKLKSSKERRKLKHGDESCDIGEEQPVFGVTLPLALERSRCHDGVEIPLVVRECIMHIEETGLSTEGIYKISGIKSKVQHVRRLYNQRDSVSLSDYDLPVATSLLKLFFRELPETLLTSKLLSKFEEASGIRDVAARGVELSSLMKQLPACNFQLLSWIIKHLLSVSMHEKQNKMSLQSISQVFSQPLQMSQRLLAALIFHADVLFSSTELTKYIPPLTSSSSNLPETADEITKELNKQESLLGQIHSEMNAGYVTKEREELLWEVQRMITQLKRKLKSLEKEAVEINHNPAQQTQSITPAGSGTTDDPVPDSTTDITSGTPSNHAPISNVTSTGTVSAVINPLPTVVPSSMTNVPCNTTTDIVSNNGGTKHIVEAVIENVIVDEEEDDNIDDNLVNDNKNETPPSQSLDNITKDAQNSVRGDGSCDTQEKISVDELALKLETEELLALIAQLQSQVEKEKSIVACLRSEIRNLGGSPSFCDYLLESCGKDVSGSTTTTDKDILFPNNNTDEQNSLSFLKQVKGESHILQMQKKNLTDSIIEEQESMIKLRVQVKLLSLNKGCLVSDDTPIVNATAICSGPNSMISIATPNSTQTGVVACDRLRNLSSPTSVIGVDTK